MNIQKLEMMFGTQSSAHSQSDYFARQVDSAKKQFEQEFQQQATITNEEIERNLNTEVKLKNELSKILYENKQKEQQLARLLSPDRASLLSAGDMQSSSVSTLLRCSSAGGLLETPVDDPFMRLNQDIQQIRDKIFVVRAESNSIMHVLEREKHVANQNHARKDELKTAYRRITQKCQDVATSKTKADNHYSKSLSEILKKQQERKEVENKHRMFYEIKYKELEQMKQDIEVATQSISENMVAETEYQDRKERIVSQLRRQLKTSEADRVNITQNSLVIDEHREQLDTLVKLVHSSKFSEVKKGQLDESSSISEWLDTVLQHYQKMVYQEAHLQIFYADLSQQEGELSAELQLVRDKFQLLAESVGDLKSVENELATRARAHIAWAQNMSFKTMTMELEREVDKNDVEFSFSYAAFQSVVNLVMKLLSILDFISDNSSAKNKGEIPVIIDLTRDAIKHLTEGFVSKTRNATVPQSRCQKQRKSFPQQRRRHETNLSPRVSRNSDVSPTLGLKQASLNMDATYQNISKQLEFTPYSKVEIGQIYLEVFKDQYAQSRNFAEHFVKIPSLQFFISEDDLIYYLKRQKNKNPISGLNELLSQAYRNEGNNIRQGFDILVLMLKKITSLTKKEDQENDDINLRVPQRESVRKSTESKINRRSGGVLSQEVSGGRALMMLEPKLLSMEPSTKKLQREFNTFVDRASAVDRAPGKQLQRVNSSERWQEKDRSTFDHKPSTVGVGLESLHKNTIDEEQAERYDFAGRRRLMKDTKKLASIFKRKHLAKSISSPRLHLASPKTSISERNKLILNQVRSIETGLRGVKEKERLADRPNQHRRKPIPTHLRTLQNSRQSSLRSLDHHVKVNKFAGQIASIVK